MLGSAWAIQMHKNIYFSCSFSKRMSKKHKHRRNIFTFLFFAIAIAVAAAAAAAAAETVRCVGWLVEAFFAQALPLHIWIQPHAVFELIKMNDSDERSNSIVICTFCIRLRWLTQIDNSYESLSKKKNSVIVLELKCSPQFSSVQFNLVTHSNFVEFLFHGRANLFLKNVSRRSADFYQRIHFVFGSVVSSGMNHKKEWARTSEHVWVRDRVRFVHEVQKLFNFPIETWIMSYEFINGYTENWNITWCNGNVFKTWV